MKPLIFSICCLLPLLSGCGRKSTNETPPTERNRLVIRMFHSMTKGESAAAAEQAQKLRALDPGNAYLATIVDTQRGNALIREAQARLDAGAPEEAMTLLEEGRKTMPLHAGLGREILRLQQLAALQTAVKAYGDATGLAGRSVALTELERVAARTNHPALTAELKRQRAALTAEIAAEVKRREAAARAREAQEKKSNAPAIAVETSPSEAASPEASSPEAVEQP